MRIQSLCLLLSVMIFQQANAQDSSLLKMMNDSMSAHPHTDYVTGTFKAMYIVNMQTVEGPARGALNFEIQHRFGKLNDGAYNFFGLDNATLRLGLDYGLTDRLVIGIGRSSFLKTFDGYLKYKLIRQGASGGSPFTVSLLGTIDNYTQQDATKPYLDATYRTSYTVQALIARKMSRTLSIEITPTYLHFNLVPGIADKNDVFAIPVGARMKISKRMSINAEYDYMPDNQLVSVTRHNSFSLGWDIETGGHVFQLIFTNSQSMLTSQYVAQTPGNWGNGDIYFGFNISRAFNISKRAKGKVAQP